ncbi:hypothetical protein SAMN02744115_00797 [Cellulosimicrobium cellulans J1]|nr:hypothetical protein SAMN02744115_00797 [Cellulosimicrobium cellulans J1]
MPETRAHAGARVQGTSLGDCRGSVRRWSGREEAPAAVSWSGLLGYLSASDAQLAAAAARASFHAESVVGARIASSPTGTIVVSSRGVPK